MITLISPAKTLDFESPVATRRHSQPLFLDDAQVLIEQLQRLTPPEVSRLMAISDSLGNLNFHRYFNWHRPFTLNNARQALLAFKGDVYRGLEADRLDEDDLCWAQERVRILSGLYGLLKPLDLIQPYRLEMSTRLATDRGDNLYRFWNNRITDSLNRQLPASAPTVINLASVEYFRAVNSKRLQARVITPVFRDWNNGQYKTISFYAKKARGMMAAYQIQHRIDDPEALKDFDRDGYRYDPGRSTASEWVFTRKLNGQ